MAKKILIINTTFDNGGAAMVARDLFHSLNNDNMETYFAYGRGEKSSENKTFKFGNNFETLLHVFLVRFLGLEGYGSYFATRKLIRYIQKEKFDLIHLHNLHGYYLNFYALLEFLNKSGIRIIWTLHDEWILNPLFAHSGDCSYPKTYNQLFLNQFFRRKQKVLNGLKNLIIVSPAGWLADRVRNSYLKSHDIRVINNGVDTDLFQPASNKIELKQKHQLPTEMNIILFSAANLNDVNKGTKYIVKTAEILKDKNYLFLGIGSGELPTRNNIKILKYISDRKAMAELFSLADLFCITSKVETQPLTVLEAFSSGLPVVGFDILALREIVNNETGSLVAFGDLMQFSQAIVSNLTDSVQGEKSKNARNRAIADFSYDMFLKNYLSLY